MAQVYVKDPDAVLDYVWDWTAWLAAGESISTATVTADAGLTLDSPASLFDSARKVRAWLSGGTARKTYRVCCRIVTSAGRTDDRSLVIQAAER